MPVCGLKGNHLGVGEAVLCRDITSAGQLFDHGLPDIPASIDAVQKAAVGAGIDVQIVYDKANSTSTKMKLFTVGGGAATPSHWIVTPIGGEVDW